ncbi:MAG: glycosyltransferase [Alphaproteobacteria bacterium]|nr:glycosyltransferase [Alphaproteobacteria bacterium]
MATIPAISIITPTFNRREALLRAVASVRAQGFQHYEHIIVDDGSTDGTADELSMLQDSRLRYVALQKHVGANAARNHGLHLASSNLLTFLDSDDEFLPGRLERSVSFLGERPEIDLSISSFHICKDGRTMTPTVNQNALFDARTLERSVFAQVTSIAGTAITVRRRAIEAVGLFDEGLWRLQDRDLLLRLAVAGYGAAILDEIDWIKHYSADSISRQRHGYVAAYGELMRRHPDLRQRYPEMVSYMVARRLLNSLLQGRIGDLMSDYRDNLRHDQLRFSGRALVCGYHRGRQQRGRIQSEIGDIARNGSTADRSRSPALLHS